MFRQDREKKIILALAIMVFVVYGLTFGIEVIQKNQVNESKDLQEQVRLSATPNAIHVVNSTEPYSLTRTKEGWMYDGDADLRISRAEVTFLNSALKSLRPKRIIIDGADYYREFGLDDPDTVITMDTEWGRKTYYIGNYNSVLDEYYMTVDDSDCIYLISSDDIKLINRSLLQIVDVPMFVGTSSTEIQSVYVKASEEYKINRTVGSYKVEWEEQYFDTTEYRLSNIHSSFNSAPYICRYHNAAEKDMVKCGLNAPDVVVKFVFTDGSEFELTVGTGLDGFHYINENDEDVIYQISDSSYEEIIERTRLSAVKNK